MPGVRWQATVLSHVLVWYAVSFAGILLNKRILSPGSFGECHVEPVTLALTQTLSTVIFGSLSQTQCRMREREDGSRQRGARWLSPALLWLGLLRFLVVFLGLVSLRFVAASFTETIKASSPFFTVIAAYLLMGERTEPRILASLAFVVGGLTAASMAEVSFTLIGFAAAILTNAVECVQNVFCKQLLQSTVQNGETGKVQYTPSQLQYYSAAASLLVQLPIFCIALLTGHISVPKDALSVCTLGTAGFVYYLQSALVFRIMSFYSPVTVSVLNTAKRALIIVFSSMYFGNIITPGARCGTAVTLLGSGLYSYFRSTSHQRGRSLQQLKSDAAGNASPPLARRAVDSTPVHRSRSAFHLNDRPLRRAFTASSLGHPPCTPARHRPQQRRGGHQRAPIYSVIVLTAVASSAVRAAGLPQLMQRSGGDISMVRGSLDSIEECGVQLMAPALVSLSPRLQILARGVPRIRERRPCSKPRRRA
eukprot:TRINITY_DN29087_c0_g1_i1.p1 TRINITY_DN29087_c0_g1~~TRINITY_DN29087_c0_g1_i1.p1  ORF type:complete len:504 (+),score=52.36 TRINITY_DN29087_c0_g1_i1:77-1513(+)